MVGNISNNLVKHWCVGGTIDDPNLITGVDHIWQSYYQNTYNWFYIFVCGGEIRQTILTVHIFRLAIRISWSTVSKAFQRSRKTTSLIRPLSILISQLSVAVMSDIAVECAFQKPNWCLVRILLRSIYDIIFFSCFWFFHRRY